MNPGEVSPETFEGEGHPIPDMSGLSIGALREGLAKIDDRTELERWCSGLIQDRRAGARALGERTLRRIQADLAELERLKGLFEYRAALMERGCKAVAGVDEVGVGPLAGPVVAAAVLLPSSTHLPGLNDSKKLSAQARERLAEAIREQALAFSLGEVSSGEIDRVNILQATLEAMRRAVSGLHEQVSLDHVLVDARKVPGISIPQTAIVHGDAIDGSIAAASIVAKVYRDGLMKRFAEEFPGYGLERHMGYGTAAHIEALGRLGVCTYSSPFVCSRGCRSQASRMTSMIRFRVEPEDFKVEEIPLYPPVGEGGHTFVRVLKRLRTSDAVARQLAVVAGVPARDIGYAGRKDRVAVTTQWMSVPGLDPEAALSLELDGAEIIEAVKHPHKLRTGQLRGNIFELLLREVDSMSEELARERLAKIEIVGMSNRYGTQRFGHAGRNPDRGRSILSGEVTLRDRRKGALSGFSASVAGLQPGA